MHITEFDVPLPVRYLCPNGRKDGSSQQFAY